MRIALFATALLAGAALPASAQTLNTSFRGFRLEGNVGYDMAHARGQHDDQLGYGGTVGFDGQIGDRIVVGIEGSYWRPKDWPELSEPGVLGGTAYTKMFEEYGVAGRVGVLLTPRILVFGKGGEVYTEQRKSFVAPFGQTSTYGHGYVSGYQYGGGVEFSLTDMFYVSGQYVRSNYEGHTRRDRAMGGIGIRFK